MFFLLYSVKILLFFFKYAANDKYLKKSIYDAQTVSVKATCVSKQEFSYPI